MRKVMPYVGLGTAVLTGILAIVMQMRIAPVTVIPTSTPTVTVLHIPACPTEDSDNCVWDAQSRGNHKGTSFITYQGKTYYAR